MDPVLLLGILFNIGITAEAMTGALAAGEKRMDLFGVLVVAAVTAFGGGTVRDVLIGRYPLIWIARPELLLLTTIAAIAMVAVARYARRLEKTFLALDALGLATFTIVGAQRALDFGHGIAVASLMGIITGVFGGILRDMLCNRLPLVFKEELYASVSFITVWLFLFHVKMDISDTVSVPLTLIFGFAFRMLALRYGWKMPRFVYTTEEKT